MKCKYCGGNITLETAYCPYCGKPNEHAQQHAKDMEMYQDVYEETRSDVHEAAHKYTGTTIRMIVIAVLAILITALLVVSGNAYSIRRMWMQSRTEKNAKKVMAQMEEYLENEDFLAFTTYCEENCIDTYDTIFEKYTPAERAARTYRYIYNDIMRVACPPTYADMDSIIESLSDNLDYFYQSTDMEEYQYYDIDIELNQKALDAMEEKAELLLQTYCGLTKEEADAIKTMSKAKRSVTLEEGILGE